MKKTPVKLLISALAAILLSALAPVIAVSADETAFLISDASGFDEMRARPDGDFVVAADISLPEEFIPLEDFTGTLSGGGHTVTLTARGDHPDGFALIMENNGTVTDLNVVCDVAITVGGSANVGGIAAESFGGIYDCAVSGVIDVTVTDKAADEYVYVGGIVGYSEEEISGCVSSCGVRLSGTGIMHVGGIAGGTFENVVINSSCSSDIYAEGINVMAGGIVGECDGKSGYSSFSGTVTAKGVSLGGKNSYAYAGGIAGYALDHSVQCGNSGEITAFGDQMTSAYAGGSCGVIYGRITRFTNTGRISAEAGYIVYAGGVAGRVSETVNEAENKASVTVSGNAAEAWIGGIAGRMPSCESCRSDCDIGATAKKLNIGGIGGECDSAKNCSSSGKIVFTAVEALSGGIAGSMRTASDCSSSCAISASGRFCEILVGGITAKSYFIVSSSEFSGSVTAETAGGYIYAGGIIAYNTSGVRDCEATPSFTIRMETTDASGVIAVGCIAGGNYGTISGCKGVAKIYANAILNTTVRGSGRKISIFAGNNAGMSRVAGKVEDSTARSRINAYIISGGVAKPKLNYD